MLPTSNQLDRVCASGETHKLSPVDNANIMT